MLIKWSIILFAKRQFQHSYTNTIIHKSSDLKSLIVAVTFNSNKSALDYCIELLEDIVIRGFPTVCELK